MGLTPVRELDFLHVNEINTLVSKAFGYTAPHQYLDDFPVWGANSKEVVRLGIFDESASPKILVGHVGIHYAWMQTTSGQIRVSLIGAVATDENYRGKGVSTQLLNDAMARSKHAGAQWIFLWGSEHHFYKKFGFELMGLQGRVSLLELRDATRASTSVSTGLTERIFQHLLHQKTGLRLEEKDRDWFFAHKTVKWFYLEEPFAFIGFERGMDLTHLVHEWGGDPTALKSIFAHLLTVDPLAQILGRVEDLIDLGFEPASVMEEYLCLAHPEPSSIGATPEWNSEFWISGLSAC